MFYSLFYSFSFFILLQLVWISLLWWFSYHFFFFFFFPPISSFCSILAKVYCVSTSRCWRLFAFVTTNLVAFVKTFLAVFVTMSPIAYVTTSPVMALVNFTRFLSTLPSVQGLICVYVGLESCPIPCTAHWWQHREEERSLFWNKRCVNTANTEYMFWNLIEQDNGCIHRVHLKSFISKLMLLMNSKCHYLGHSFYFSLVIFGFVDIFAPRLNGRFGNYAWPLYLCSGNGQMFFLVRRLPYTNLESVAPPWVTHFF